MGFINQLITGGHHPATSIISIHQSCPEVRRHFNVEKFANQGIPRTCSELFDSGPVKSCGYAETGAVCLGCPSCMGSMSCHKEFASQIMGGSNGQIDVYKLMKNLFM